MPWRQFRAIQKQQHRALSELRRGVVCGYLGAIKKLKQHSASKRAFNGF